MVAENQGLRAPTRSDFVDPAPAVGCQTPGCGSTASTAREVLVFAGDAGGPPSRTWMCPSCERVANEYGIVARVLGKRRSVGPVDVDESQGVLCFGS